MPAAPKVFSIPAGAPFLATLVDALLAGRFGPIGADPLGLADITILLPTRRAVRALSDLFAERMGGAAILPNIRPIGDVDEEEFLLQPRPETGEELLLLPQAIDPLARRLELTGLVLAWSRSVRRDLLGLQPGEPLLIPASAADALRLAGDLGRLIDEFASAGVDWDRLTDLVPADYPKYWQITLDFLRIASEFWPARLAELGMVDPATRRDRLIRAEAARLTSNPPSAPVIAAGSTGSIPATAELLTAIARLPAGAVVLPGLDRELDEPGFEAIGDHDGRAAGHPQFGLRQLLTKFGISRSEVEPIGRPAAAASARARILSEAMRPADTTDAWRAHAPPDPAALGGVALLVARNEIEEALAIAFALRDAVEEGKVAALVTPDRTIARRVAAELRRFGLEIDDSAGATLLASPPANLARLLLEAAISDGEPLRLLALAKHPLTGFGQSHAACRRGARTIERAVFRGRGLPGGLDALFDTLRRAETRQPALAEADWEAARLLVRGLERALGPLIGLKREAMTVAQATRCLAEALGQAADEGDGSGRMLWQAGAGETLAGLLAALIESGERLALSLPEYAPFLAAAMEGAKVPAPPRGDPRIHLWGTLEARLQHVDLMILAGLDEGIWPASASTDPWLSRPMRTTIGLDPPERRIGLAAHDFAEAMAAPRVLVTRAEKRGGSPAVASRWLQRLNALLGDAAFTALRGPAARHLAFARAVDFVPVAEPVARPAPVPPVALRPRTLSITEIETFVRDPYAIYAKHVLRLRRLEPIGRLPDAAMRGNLIHEVLAEFGKNWTGAYDAEAEAALIAAFDKALEPYSGFPDVYALWRLRGEAVTRWFVRWEGRRHDIAERRIEISGKMTFGAPAGPFTLQGRADRIDVTTSGVEIYDFKTGTPPTARQVLTGFAPQLALEAAMVTGGAFGDDLVGRPIDAVAWLALNRVGRGDEVKTAIEKGETSASIASRAMEQLRALVAAYDAPDRAYRSLERPMFERRWVGDYDHLARLAEWRLAGWVEDED